MGTINRMKGAPEPLLDTTPMELPIGFRRPPSLQEYIARMVRDAVELEKGEEFESWEESDDFEEEDPDTLDFSKYELQELQQEHSIQDYGPDPDPDYKAAPAASEEPTHNSGPPDPDAVPAE